ncbi:hypothetical protein ACVNNN_24720 [Lysinibacillus fusiformis]
MTLNEKHSKKKDIFEMKTKEDLKQEEFLEVLAEMFYFHIVKKDEKKVA